MGTEVAAVILKPCTIRDVLDGNIICDMEESGFEIGYRKMWKFESEDVKSIYPNQQNKPIFPFAVHALTHGPSMVVVTEGIDVYQRLTKFKGKMNTSGVRNKYRRYQGEEELRQQGYRGVALGNKLAENIIHTPDNYGETLVICALAFRLSDRQNLTDRYPQLVRDLQKASTLALHLPKLSGHHPST